MRTLYAAAATVEQLAHDLDRHLLDNRRFTVDQVVDALNSGMDEASSAVQDPDLLSRAVKLIQDDYAAVRQSTGFCGRYDRNSVRVEHCASGIYLRGYREGDITNQRIASLEVNLEDGQSWLDARACPTNPRSPCPYLHLHIPAWSRWSENTMGHDTALGFARTLRYTNLGIGKAVYRRAANIVPNARWAAGTLFEDSKAVRRSLHREDPWRWQDPYCPVCGTHFNRLRWAEEGRQRLAAAHPADTAGGLVG